MSTTPSNDSPPGADLARKLNLLLDSAEAEGHRIAFNDVRDAMADAGTPISRARWHYMRAGTGPAVKKADLLRNLAAFFGVNSDYLLTDQEELPERVEAQLELLASMKAAKVRNYAARQLDGLSPETLLQIRDLIDEHLANPPQRTLDSTFSRRADTIQL
ncbi:hypothetical protein ACOM2C_04540 [Pseudarthrobacter sp. So.54]